MSSNCFRLLLAVAVAAAQPVWGLAPVTIIVTDPPGQGFNDPSPAVPAGGNTGTTLGEQRLIAMQYAASIVSSQLDSPVPITIRVGFRPLACSAKSGTMGGTHTSRFFVFDEAGPEIMRAVWYPGALVNKLIGRVRDPGYADMTVSFNPDLGQPGCLESSKWYYGLDNQPPPSQQSMVTVALHEVAHGLGFAADRIVADDPGTPAGLSVFAHYLYDTGKAKFWSEMTDEQLRQSARNYRRVVWSGINGHRMAARVLKPGTPALRITAPPSQAGYYYVGTASFGDPLRAGGVSGQVVLAMDSADEAGPSPMDGCSPLVNALEAAGKIALVYRGGCPFTQKAINAQNAGAIGLVVVNNEESASLPNLAGVDSRITIPVVHVTRGNGDAFRVSLESHERVEAKMLFDPSMRLGADPAGRPLLYTPELFRDGTTGNHWDSSASPDQLMEPDVPEKLDNNPGQPNDLTLAVLRDLGWFSDYDGVPDGIDQCPDSDTGQTLRILNCDTGVINKTSPAGCRASDFYKRCRNPEGNRFASCVGSVSNEMLKVGFIEKEDVGKIQACAAQAIRTPANGLTPLPADRNCRPSAPGAWAKRW